ncbi:type VI secretion system contractile sheath large subunit [Vibrio sp. SCSIO 43136]|uniref:type VI secretion system contractile sheath domain-containing protein n=1 Tax=Vibrio sp. SCSIO 43136 TaxID=2819101 RepID=UPI0020754469|nr:type VI secretion system contractile sheath large subunit [Vibrio sp. SCSIO 43136]USD66344.1 type VI secretion system contractile sheath large subunit [Vibrio sp. SCSIO 43136]
MLSSDFQHQLNQLDSTDEQFVEQALELIYQLDPEMLRNQQSLLSSISLLIADIDAAISTQVSEILHHPEFSALEASWSGVESLVSLPINYHKTNVRLLDFSWDELSHELNSSVSLRRTTLFNLIGNKELNTSGGKPFGMVVVDHDISMNLDGDYDDIYTLELLSELGDLCLCPFILSMAEDFFGESGADWLSDTQRIEKILAGAEYQSWQRLREKSSSRFIGVVMPKVRFRHAYNHSDSNQIVFSERHRSPSGVWGNAGYLFASTAMREFNRINWFGFMKSRWQDKYAGALVNVPESSAQTLVHREPRADINIFTPMGIFYSDHGFIPLCHSSTTEKYFFRGNPSIWNCESDDLEAVNGQIQTTLMICRVAHYLKVQIRGMIGNFQTADECELFLNNWLDKYTSNLVNADEATLAKYPLSKGRVIVKEIAGQKGRFTCDVHVKPQYQFDNVCGEVLLSTDLGPETGGTGYQGGLR